MTPATRNDAVSPAPAAEPLAPLIVILGPTASGKSALAVSLAERFGGEVLACDSSQVYRGFDIGTGKPTAEERRSIPHHLIDLVEPSAVFTAGEYRRQALAALADVQARGQLPILTAGTGLYLRALLEGLADAPERSDALRERLQAGAARRGLGHLHRMLRRLDPAAAARISANDGQKLIRALEICLLAGQPVTDVHRSGRVRLEGYAVVKVGLNPPRPALYERIGRRVRGMLERGWLAEVSALLGSGAPLSAKPFEFIGYRELREHLEPAHRIEPGEPSSKMPSAKVVDAIAQATRRYAKRQLTWFRREAGVLWLAGFGDDADVLAAAVAAIETELPSLAAGPELGCVQDPTDHSVRHA
jgi:tRNA dimethylallyltransferase